MKNCQSCGAPLVWVTTPSGGRMPLNRSPTADGNVLIVSTPLGAIGVTLSKDALAKARAEAVNLRLPHHANCPEGQSWKKKRSRSEPQRQTTMAT